MTSRGFIIAFLALLALPSLAGAQGYEGVFAMPGDDSEKSAAPAGDGYTGVFGGGANAQQEEAPAPGYSGVFSGSADNTEEKPAQATRRNKNFTEDPASKTDDMGVLALVQNAPPLQVPGAPADHSNLRHDKINGMSESEYAAEQSIEHELKRISAKDITPEERKKLATKAYKRFADLADGYRLKQHVSDDIYRHMGLTDAYIRVERASNDGALKRLDAALKILKPHI
jgi:hypothetical protein